mmetsp:Transcript_14448/g.13051  ORF Transcript_14448/g.13051 Transcript_14448/m.13051 type:complete len:273 (+) Transcript_14448:89-907(+)
MKYCYTKMNTNNNISPVFYDFDKMSEEELKKLCQLLIIENNSLKLSLLNISGENKTLNEKLSSILIKANTDHLIIEQNDSLKELVKQLQEENFNLKNDELRKQLDEQKELISSHENRIKALEDNNKPITIREAMRILERHICMEVAGSKNSFRKLFNFEKIKICNDSTYKTKLEGIFQSLGLTEDHITLLHYLKDTGDYVVYVSRPVYTFDEWKNLMTDLLSSDADDMDNAAELANDLLDALKVYIPPTTSTEPWIINDPIGNVIKPIYKIN